MTCLEADIRLVPTPLLADVLRVGGLGADISPSMPCLSADVSREDIDIRADVSRCIICLRREIERIDVALEAEIELICSVAIPEEPYLEIEPTILWVYPDIENTNDVFSNTYWRIN